MLCARFNQLLSILALSVLSLAGGCNPADHLTYQQAYEQKLYPQALEKATLVAQDDRAPDHQRAQLVAGMSAQSMGKYDEAKKWLIPLKLSPDKDIAARARASLGLIAKAEGKSAEAATLLSGSADNLDGDEAAKAKMNAGDAYRQLGLETKAQEEYKEASAEAADPALKAAANLKSIPKVYYVQCGAYSSRQTADKQLLAIKSKVVSSGQPAPTVLQLSPNGTPLFVVQVGPYVDKQAAMTAKARMNMPSAAVVAR